MVSTLAPLKGFSLTLSLSQFDTTPITGLGITSSVTANGIINIKNKKWEDDFSPIDEMGHTFVDLEYSKAYLRHLFAANEYLGKQIATIHNLGFYMWLVREARRQILSGTFRTWKDKMVVQMAQRL